MRPATLPLFVLLLPACVWSAAPPAEPPAVDVSTLPALPAVSPARVTGATSLLDHVPETLAGQAASSRGATDDGAAGAWSIAERRITLDLSPITDIRAERARWELLGKDATARMHGQEVRGLRLQGNPAQVMRGLNPPHRTTLVVVAANTYTVRLQVEPSASADEALALAEGIDIGGLTRLALDAHREPAP